jgi:hypothetical protein
MVTGVFGAINRESIDEVYRNGLVKPNEYESIRDNIIDRELYLRHEAFSYKLNYFFLVLQKIPLCEFFYISQTGIFDVKEAILYMAYNTPEELLIEVDDVSTMVLADVAYNKACKVRDLGDLNRSKLVQGDIYADKETIRSLEYLTRYKRGLWDLLECLNVEDK